MYQYIWDEETGGLLLTTEIMKFSKEPRPVYYQELDLLGFDQYWDYPKDDRAPLLWAEANNYIYKGRKVASIKGGALYTAPEIQLFEEPEPDHKQLQFVDIPKMVEKNSALFETLTQETIKQIYNTYVEYREKIDVFHVSFSGGKDSLVTLHLVQRALPHDDIIVIFGNTGMEFPDTKQIVDEVEEKCKDAGIRFFTASSKASPLDTWKLFGEPSSAIRWCCSVHKTTPQLLKLREITGKNDIREMAFVGVRGDESVRRSGYGFISMGTKQKGQYSCNPILDWSSAEIFLYLYTNGITIHKAYKMGSARVGCLLCPMSTNKSDFINYHMYPAQVQPFVDIIYSLNASEGNDIEKLRSYVNNKAWKARKNGRDLTIGIRDFTEEKKNGMCIISFKDNNNVFREWIKTVGEFVEDEKYCTIKINSGQIFKFKLDQDKDHYVLSISESIVKESPTFYKNLKNILKKVHCCVGCKVCAANCPNGNISFVDSKVVVSDNCTHCGLCNELENGCLRYKSLWLPKGMSSMKSKSIDSYGTHAPKLEWIRQFIELQDSFNTAHKLGSVEFPMFKKFLRDCGILEKNDSFNALTQMLFSSFIEDTNMWALFFTNLAYSAEVGWLVQHLDFQKTYNQKELIEVLSDYTTSKTGPRNIVNSYKRMSLLPLSHVGFCKVIEGSKAEGFNLIREAWDTPDPRVILYSLYKFAENCGDYYQFTLTTLLDDSIERDGISPTRIFGLDRDTMEPLLNGLSANYSDFISASFSLGLDTINLHEDKTSQDVLALF